jgi:YegS/Rv2252/BmrU family lipid kinase
LNLRQSGKSPATIDGAADRPGGITQKCGRGISIEGKPVCWDQWAEPQMRQAGVAEMTVSRRIESGMTKRALLIVNRSSRQGSKDLAPALELLRARLGLEEAEAGSVDEAITLIRGRQQEVDGIIMAGGDGTLQGVASALLETDLTLGILPLGTANDFAAALQIPMDLPGAAKVIAAGHVRRIDLASVNGVLFFNVAHIGLGARVTMRVTSEAKQQWGRWSYLRTLLATVTERRAFWACLEHGSIRDKIRVIQITIGNGSRYGGGMVLTEGAGLDDGLLHVCSVAPARLWKLLALFLQLRRGATQDPEAMRLLHLPEITIRTRKRMRVTAGGESVTETPAHFRVLPAALRVFAPPQLSEAGP